VADSGKGGGATSIVQVLGVAYTYQPSLAVRRHLIKHATAYHSAKDSEFSYFYKGDRSSIVGNDEKLYLRLDPRSGCVAQHWPEPELAALLGERHEIVAYTLANDLTAISIEASGRTTGFDGTYLGKVWNKSGSLGPSFVPANLIDDTKLTIGLRIVRQGIVLYNEAYSTSRRLRPFNEVSDLIVESYRHYDGNLPPSKRIAIDSSGFLAAGTVIMLGSGLIVRPELYCEAGDCLSVSCEPIGELSNSVVLEQPNL
jgi:2-keto-4-pentenoate hydratase/2-oxohepta-3-ene-1,7-dioic acid hydratase in catechol pathway